MTIVMKICSSCKEELPVNEFYCRKENADGLQGRCKECMKSNDRLHWQKRRTKRKPKKREYDKKYYQKNKKRIQEKQKQYYANNGEKVRAQVRSYYQRTRDKQLEYRKKHNANPKNKRKLRDYIYRRDYGISIEEYESMLAEQGGVCAICKKKETVRPRRLAVDHCHETGAVRALLCGNCNKGLGCFRHDTKLLLIAADYMNCFCSVN